MSIKLALLKSGESVISDAKELIIGEGDEQKVVGYIFDTPHKVEYHKPILLSEERNLPEGELQVSLSPWILLTSDKKIPVPTDWIITIVEPLESIKEMYNISRTLVKLQLKDIVYNILTSFSMVS